MPTPTRPQPVGLRLRIVKVTLEQVSHQMKPRYSAFRASPFLSPTGCQAKMNAGEVRTVRRLENLRYDNALRKRIAAFPDGFCEVNMAEVISFPPLAHFISKKGVCLSQERGHVVRHGDLRPGGFEQ